MHDVIETVRRVVADDPDILLCIVYGSAASGRMTDRSDVDVAVAGRKPLDPGKRTGLYLDLSRKLGREVDVRDLRILDGLILKEILTKGTVVKKTDSSLLAGLITRMLFFDADMMPNIRYILETRARRFTNE